MDWLELMMFHHHRNQHYHHGTLVAATYACMCECACAFTPPTHVETWWNSECLWLQVVSILTSLTNSAPQIILDCACIFWCQPSNDTYLQVKHKSMSLSLSLPHLLTLTYMVRVRVHVKCERCYAFHRSVWQLKRKTNQIPNNKQHTEHIHCKWSQFNACILLRVFVWIGSHFVHHPDYMAACSFRQWARVDLIEY